MAVAELLERSISPSKGLYLRVAFWPTQVARDRGDKPHVESFHFSSARRTRMVPQTDANGHWILKNGGTHDPAVRPHPTRDEVEMVEEANDVKAYLRNRVQRYIARIDWRTAMGMDRSDTRYARSTRAEDDTRDLLTATDGLSIEG